MDDQSDLTARLEALGNSRPSPPTAARLDAIEARVMAGTIGVSATSPIRRRSVPMLLTAAAAVIALVVTAVVFANRGAEPIRFDVADGVVLELPGEMRAAASGDDVPDGAVVAIAPGGLAVIGTDRYGPGRYQVVDGRLVPFPATTATSTSTTSTTSTTTTSTSPRADRTTVPTRPTTTLVRPTTEPVPRTTTTTSPKRDEPTIPTDRPTTTTGPATTSTTTSPPSDTRPSTTTAETRPTTTTTTPRDTRPTTTTTTTAVDRDRVRDRRPDEASWSARPTVEDGVEST
jgi:hypothetical protein